MINKIKRNEERKTRQKAIREKLLGTKEVPRLSVYKSLKNVYVQLIDDKNGHTIISACTLEKGLKESDLKKKEVFEKIGETIAKKAQTLGIKEVKFDRGGYKYHGNIAALADSARKAGLEF